MIRVLGHDAALLRLYWAGDNPEVDETVAVTSSYIVQIGTALTEWM